MFSLKIANGGMLRMMQRRHRPGSLPAAPGGGVGEGKNTPALFACLARSVGVEQQRVAGLEQDGDRDARHGLDPLPAAGLVMVYTVPAEWARSDWLDADAQPAACFSGQALGRQAADVRAGHACGRAQIIQFWMHR